MRVLGQSDGHSIYRSRNGGHLLRAAGFTCRRSVAPAEGARVFLSAEDAALWSHHVLSNTSALSYLEWGSGGTTVVAAWRALQAQALGIPSLRVVSIESSPKWLRHLHSRYPVLRQAEANAPLQLESASLEPTGMWGIPMGWMTRPLSLRRQQVLNYSAVPTSLAVPGGPLAWPWPQSLLRRLTSSSPTAASASSAWCARCASRMFSWHHFPRA